MGINALNIASAKEPVDYVNPYMGNISHVLKPTYPTVQLPNSMLRVLPRRADFADMRIEGLPLMSYSHRNVGKIGVEVFSSDEEFENKISYPRKYFYDREKITPYEFSVFLEEENVAVRFAPSHKSAIYEFDFTESKDADRHVRLFGGIPFIICPGSNKSGKDGGMEVVLPRDGCLGIMPRFDAEIKSSSATSSGDLIFVFDKSVKKLRMKYGVTFVGIPHAEKNLEKEIPDFDIDAVAEKGRKLWNEKLSKIKVSGNEQDKELFYTSLWRTYERMIDVNEYGKFYNAFQPKNNNPFENDDSIIQKGDEPFYTDDWIWDTYLTSHPLRILIEPEMEAAMLNSYVKMAQASEERWLPTFPQIWGDSHAMNGNHVIISFLDAQAKGLKGVDYNAAYELALNTLEFETITPWVRGNANELDLFYKKYGFFPALREGEAESVSAVNKFERRQSVAVTQSASYDEWALSELAKLNSDEENVKKYSASSQNYKNLWNEKTQFFHPKDKEGKFIEPFDYRFSGGMGFRDYYDENNGHTYRWNIAFNIDELISLMGGKENFAKNLDDLFITPLGKSKIHFYAENGPDQSGNIGQFAMGNEPSFHIPYLYNYAGKPWKTQKTTRMAIDMWFKNNLLGIPGDEDGGAMSAFVVFSMLGIYPTTPGKPIYDITSPYFEEAIIDLGNNKTLKIIAKNTDKHNKYIQSATLNGQPISSPQILHKDIAGGGTIEFTMGESPNHSWGIK